MPTFVLIGSGPGIGRSTASLFAQRGFEEVILLSRNIDRLHEDQQFILRNTQAVVKHFAVDITNTTSFNAVLKSISQDFQDITCVVFNAAKVEPSGIFDYSAEDIAEDFATTNIAMYTAAQWAFPILANVPQTSKPSFLVTSSLLWKEPFPMFFSLSMVKASQRNLAQSLAAVYPNVHTALLNVGGQVSIDHPELNPTSIAEKMWELYNQKPDAWTFDLDVLPAA